MDAKQIVLLAFGEQKAKAVAQAVEGPLTAICPASILQLHPTVKVFLDEAAASQLQRTEYYRWVFSNKPEWQRD
jgi:glucosamine-6-phosphate deaminase